MKPITLRGIAAELAGLVREESSRGSLLTLIGLDLAAFAAAAAMALIVPDGFDAAASGANESALVFAVPVQSPPAPEASSR